MRNDTLEQERQSLKIMRDRWKAMGWLFTPLDKIDGENEVIDSLYALRESPLCWRAIDSEPLDSNNERLIEGLEDLYRRAMQSW